MWQEMVEEDAKKPDRRHSLCNLWMPLVPLANGIQSLFGELERSARARSSLITRSGILAALFNQPFAYLPMYSKFSFDVEDYKSAGAGKKNIYR